MRYHNDENVMRDSNFWEIQKIASWPGSPFLLSAWAVTVSFTLKTASTVFTPFRSLMMVECPLLRKKSKISVEKSPMKRISAWNKEWIHRMGWNQSKSAKDYETYGHIPLDRASNVCEFLAFQLLRLISDWMQWHWEWPLRCLSKNAPHKN